MIREAHLEATAEGLVPCSDGWYVLNARRACWLHADGRSAVCDFEGEGDAAFPQLGINLSVLAPGQTMAMYHWEIDQENFLVISGEARLIVEGVERMLGQWDFVHCPAGTKHVIVGVGAGPCVVLAVGARGTSNGPDWGGYTVEPAAAPYGASVEEDTTEPQTAYARLRRRRPVNYQAGWLAADD